MPLTDMADSYTFVLYYLWIAPHALLAVVAALMFVRRLHRKVPVFFLYCLYEICEFLLLFFHRHTLIAPAQKVFYRYLFIATFTGSTALRFGIIQEVFNDLFRDYERLERFASISMRSLTGLLVGAAALSAFYSTGTVSESLMTGVALLGRSVAIIQAGLLLFLFLFSRMFGLSWRSFVFGIALGFGILASTELAVWALRLTGRSVHFAELLNLLPTGSYHVSVLVWIGYLLTAEKPVGAARGPDPARLSPAEAGFTVPEMDQWSGELERSPQ